MQAAGWKRPEFLLPVTFLAAIVVGTGVLLLPGMTTGNEPVGPLEAFFTATSAVCVTGLIVVDTGSAFTEAGQAVILTLIQLGGLGIMTFSVLVLVLAGKRLALQQEAAFRETFTQVGGWRLSRLLGAIFAVTLLFEGIGFLILRGSMDDNWSALFHAVSAFCNAGFSLNANSLQHESTLAVLTCLGLFVIGGLGFTTLLELGRALRPRRGKSPRFSLHAKLVFITTFALWGIGAIVMLLEGNSLLDSVFMSASTRTAGFDTTPVGLLSGAVLVIYVPLMFIGASPGSTGGGIKTTTFALFLLHSVSVLRGRDHVRAFGREVPLDQVRRMFAVVACSGVIVFFAIFFLYVFEGEHSEDLLGLGFEAVSAFGTVGLSTGITSELSAPSQLLLCAVMFIGRVGSLSIFLAILRQAPPRRVRRPEERILIG
jgi:trk system potassium uptake protein TrkH